jgi:S-adenosylmethionine-diacylglycerol 3-amino-3-carboxypropyl transferase
MVQDFVVDTQAGASEELTGPVADVAPLAAAVVTWARDSILFSSCNEDSHSELRAFGSLAGKRVLCITAGGGRVLNLLAARPEVIWAVDLNPAQNYLLELKVAGMRALSHEAYLCFLGVRASSERLATYRRVREQLTPGARSFFDAHPQLIEDGILFQGRLERYLRRISKVLQWTHALGVRRVFECQDIEKQRALLRRLDSPVFRVLAQTACRRGVLRAFSGDPGFYRYVPREVPLHREIYGGMLAHFNHHLARNNPLMQLIFFGRFIEEQALPPYLNAATYDQLKDALARVRLVTITGTISQAFEQAGPSAFDALSISDISSYLDDVAHDRLFADALASAKPGAIICSRSNIYHRPLRPEHEARLSRDLALEAELRVADHSCVHQFVIGRVQG